NAAAREVEADGEGFRAVEHPDEALLEQVLHDVLDDGQQARMMIADALEQKARQGAQPRDGAAAPPLQVLVDDLLDLLLFPAGQEVKVLAQFRAVELALAAAEGEKQAREVAPVDFLDQIHMGCPGEIQAQALFGAQLEPFRVTPVALLQAPERGDAGGDLIHVVGQGHRALGMVDDLHRVPVHLGQDRKSTLNSSHVKISYAVFCLKKKKKKKKKHKDTQ